MPKSPETALTPKRSAPTLTEVIKVALRASRLGIRTSIPGKVVKYVVAERRADIQLGILQVRYTDSGEQVLKPITIPRCPVHWPGSAAGYLAFPLVPGDTGLLVVSDRSIERWSQTGVPQDPGLRHLHNPIDGVFFPGLHNKTNLPAPAVGAATAAILEGPLVHIGDAATEPMIKATTFIALMDTAIAAAVTAAAAVTPPNGDGGTAAFTALQTAWDFAKANINAAKGRVE